MLTAPENVPPEGGVTIWRYRRRFHAGTARGHVILRSRTNGLFSQLWIDGSLIAEDYTPAFGPEAVRNHLLSATLEDGSQLHVEAGYISALNTGIAVFRDGELVHESHPGRTIAYPDKYREATVSASSASLSENMKESWKEGVQETGVDLGRFKRNWIPLSVDIVLGLVFFAVAKLTDLTTAALVGAALGLVLLVVQKLTRIDLLGGLALFGIVMLLLSALFALVFQSDEAVKYRSTVIGSLSASLFLLDGLAGGHRLARRLMLYMPYNDIDPARLGIGMGVLGLIMAVTNTLVAAYASTDVWLFYTTFADFLLSMALILLVFRYARGMTLPDMAPRYTPHTGDG